MSQQLVLKTLTEWLSSLAPPPPAQPWPDIVSGPFIRDMPDRLVSITLLPGLGYAMEGSVDQPSFQVRARGDQSDQGDAETIAMDIDTAIFVQHFPQVFADTNFLLVTRLAGMPAPLGPPVQNDGMRLEYVCTYRTVIGN